MINQDSKERDKLMLQTTLYLGHSKNTLFVRSSLPFFVVVFFFMSSKLIGQEPIADTYKWFDTMVGSTNSGIFEGVAFDENFRIINDRHQFFNNPKLSLGTVVFDQKTYFDLHLKYDLFRDNLLIINIDQVVLPPLILERDAVESFTIGEHIFENTGFDRNDEIEDLGFVEVLVQNDSLSLYKKHRKKLLKKTDEKIVSHFFKNISTYYLNFEDEIYHIKKANDLISAFPNHRKTVKEICKEYSALEESKPDMYIKSVLLDVLEFINQNSSGR